MNYVDGFVVPVPEANLADYRKLAEMGESAELGKSAADDARTANERL